jgi:hypothetical protein
MTLWHGAAIAADEQPAAGAPAPAAAPEAKPGGVQVQVPESPAMTPVSIGYLREIPDTLRPASRMDNEPDDAGIAGAKLAIQENNAGGQFTGDFYSLDVRSVASPDAALGAMQKFYGHRPSLHHRGRIGQYAAQAVRLGQGQGHSPLQHPRHRRIAQTGELPRQCHACRAGPLHAGRRARPISRAQEVEELALGAGLDAGRSRLCRRVRRAAGRFGATIVDQREYKDVSGGRRDDVGVIPPGKQASVDATFAADPNYDVIIVADEDQLFGPYMPYRGGGKPRPVAGTTGLVATTWSPGHEKWGATQMNNHFERTSSA